MGNYWEDVCSQPEQLSQAMSRYERDSFLEQMKALRDIPFGKLVFSGMGSSHYCAIGAGIYLKQHGIDNQVISTGELLYYEKSILDSSSLLVLISQSGESAETVRLIQQLSSEIRIIAITNDPDSSLARRGNFVFPLFVEPEEAVTTRTYLSSICVVMLLAAALTGEDPMCMMEGIRDTLRKMEAALLRQRDWEEKLSSFLMDCRVISIMGRGFSLGSVQAGALFFREIVKFPAMAFDEAEFKHGPLEMVENGFHAVIFAPSGPGAKYNCKMAENIVSKGGTAVLITDSDCNVEERERLYLIRLEKTEEYLSPLLQILPVQLMANDLAVQRHIPAGKFRWGSKIMGSEI